MKHRLFVYGTLRKNSKYSIGQWLQTNAQWLCEAKFQGKMYKVDYYPAVIPTLEIQAWVYGDVFDISEKVLEILDDFEDYFPENSSKSLYLRTKVNLYTIQGDIYLMFVSIYTINLLRA